MVITSFVQPLTIYAASKTPAQKLDEQLEQAKKVELVQKFFRLSTSYDIKIDGKVVGTLTGDFWHPFGDSLKIESSDGTVIYSEQQSRRMLSLSIARGGVFYNQAGEFDGALRENVWALFWHQYQVLDKSGTVIASSRRNPWQLFSTSYQVKDTQGAKLYRATTERWHLTKQIKIERLGDGDKVSMKQMLIVTAIEEAIAESKAKDK